MSGRGMRMKTVYLIGGTMGVGKTTVCQELKKELERSVFLDGDWCWDANPFQVTEETKKMVLENICFLLNQFIRCSAYEHIIFCWVMHEQEILDTILEHIDTAGCRVKTISLVCSPQTLIGRLKQDIAAGIRDESVMARSVARIPMYRLLNTTKIETDGKSVRQIALEIIANEPDSVRQKASP